MTKIIAEVGLNHMGSIELAKKYIIEVAKTGVWGIKFQIHDPYYESSKEEKFRIKMSNKYKNRYDYWKKTSFSNNEWKKLYILSKKNNLKFIVSPFSIQSLKVIEKTGVDYIKIGSGEIYNKQLIDYLSLKKRKIIASSGMSNWKEIQNIYNKLKLKSKKNLVILQCTSQYPSKLNDVGLNVISEIKKRFKCNSGLSDHSGSVFPGITAISRNEDFLEVHVKLESKFNFPDKSTSLNMNSLKFLQDYNNAMVALNNKVDKDKIYKKFSKMRKLFGRSLALKKKMIKGQIIKKEDLILKKPGTGLSIKYLNFFIGKKLNKTIVHDELLKKKYVY